jgi:hypothetical protein
MKFENKFDINILKEYMYKSSDKTWAIEQESKLTVCLNLFELNN